MRFQKQDSIFCRRPTRDRAITTAGWTTGPRHPLRSRDGLPSSRCQLLEYPARVFGQLPEDAGRQTDRLWSQHPRPDFFQPLWLPSLYVPGSSRAFPVRRRCRLVVLRYSRILHVRWPNASVRVRKEEAHRAELVVQGDEVGRCGSSQNCRS